MAASRSPSLTDESPPNGEESPFYPLPLNGFGGLRTQTMVANQFHDEICSRKITIAQAAQTLEGDWLSKGLPDND